MESLRDEQKRIARDRILEALATEIATNGLLELSISSVAERAGVSQRTIYNYFETKEALVAALTDWSEQWMERRGGPLLEPDLDKVPDALVTNFALFEDMGDITTALTRIRANAPNDTPNADRYGKGHIERTKTVQSSLAEIRPDLAAEELEALTAIFRMLMGFNTWNILTTEYGLPAVNAGNVTAWAFSVMLAAVRNGEGP